MGRTFAEKILGAEAGAIVFKKPDIVANMARIATGAHIFHGTSCGVWTSWLWFAR